MWTARHPGTFVISIEDGFDIGRHTNGATSELPCAACASRPSSVTGLPEPLFVETGRAR